MKKSNKKNRFNPKAKIKSLTVLFVSVVLLFTLVGVQFIGKVSGQWPYDWPMLGHDPQRTRHSASPAPSTNQTLWNYTTGAMIFSSPAVADGRVHVGSYDNKVYCLDAATGALVWNYTTGGVIYSSPAVADGRVYVGSSDDNLYCFDALTGDLLWNYTTGSNVRSSPAVADGKVYVTSFDRNVYCLDSATGAFIWSYATGSGTSFYSSPAVANGVVYVGSVDRQIYAFSTEPPIPEGITVGIMLLLSSVAVIVSVRYFRKRPKWESW